jgi:hypothetical protein
VSRVQIGAAGQDANCRNCSRGGGQGRVTGWSQRYPLDFRDMCLPKKRQTWKCRSCGRAQPSAQVCRHTNEYTNIGGPQMAQLVVSWLICNGRLRVHAINAIGQRKGRVIEIEDVDSGERVHGTARRLERLAQTLRSSGGDLDRISPWTPDTTS